jgi:hypothetical protein
LLIATIRREINTAVARGDVRSDQALAAVMHVVATYLAQVKDDALRQEYLASLVNELYYRDGPTPKPLALTDATLVRDTVAEALIEAFAAGKGYMICEALR